MKRCILSLLAFSLAIVLTGCGTVSHSGGIVHDLDRKQVTILLPQFENATDDEFAAIAMTEITASALMARGFRLYQTEDILDRLNRPEAPGEGGSYKAMADEVGAPYVLLGTVHEYRYKTDLDGDPAVGITLRLVDIETGRTVWTGTSSNVGFINASLTSAGQRVTRDLVRKMPFEFEVVRHHN